MTLSPVERHWAIVEYIRGLAEAMPPGPGRERQEAHHAAILADHQEFVKQQGGQHEGSRT